MRKQNMIELSSCISIVFAVADILLSFVPFVCGQYCTLHAQQPIYEFEGVSGSGSFFAHLDTIPVTVQCANIPKAPHEGGCAGTR